MMNPVNHATRKHLSAWLLGRQQDGDDRTSEIPSVHEACDHSLPRQAKNYLERLSSGRRAQATSWLWNKALNNTLVHSMTRLTDADPDLDAMRPEELFVSLLEDSTALARLCCPCDSIGHGTAEGHLSQVAAVYEINCVTLEHLPRWLEGLLHKAPNERDAARARRVIEAILRQDKKYHEAVSGDAARIRCKLALSRIHPDRAQHLYHEGSQSRLTQRTTAALGIVGASVKLLNHPAWMLALYAGRSNV